MDKDTIILVIGLFMIFIGIFGGGFQIKEIHVPKVNIYSRLIGFVFGILLILWSLDVFKIGPVDVNEEPIVEINPEELPNKNDTKDIFYELEKAWDNPDFDNSFLLAEYTKLDTSEAKLMLDLEEKNTLTKRIETLQEDVYKFNTLKAKDITDTLTAVEKLGLWKNYLPGRISEENQQEKESNIQKYEKTIAKNSFNKLKAKDASDTLTVQEKLTLWKSYKGENLSSEEQQVVTDKINKYNEILNKLASIQAKEDLVICKDVQNRNPIGVSTNFRPSTLYTWARIKAPKTENLRLEWLDPKMNKIGEKQVRVSQADGYRVYYSENFNEPGLYEVRLFNSENHLIGRRKFTIAGDG